MVPRKNHRVGDRQTTLVQDFWCPTLVCEQPTTSSIRTGESIDLLLLEGHVNPWCPSAEMSRVMANQPLSLFPHGPAPLRWNCHESALVATMDITHHNELFTTNQLKFALVKEGYHHLYALTCPAQRIVQAAASKSTRTLLGLFNTEHARFGDLLCWEFVRPKKKEGDEEEEEAGYAFAPDNAVPVLSSKHTILGCINDAVHPTEPSVTFDKLTDAHIREFVIPSMLVQWEEGREEIVAEAEATDDADEKLFIKSLIPLVASVSSASSPGAEEELLSFLNSTVTVIGAFAAGYIAPNQELSASYGWVTFDNEGYRKRNLHESTPTKVLYTYEEEEEKLTASDMRIATITAIVDANSEGTNIDVQCRNRTMIDGVPVEHVIKYGRSLVVESYSVAHVMNNELALIVSEDMALLTEQGEDQDEDQDEGRDDDQDEDQDQDQDEDQDQDQDEDREHENPRHEQQGEADEEDEDEDEDMQAAVTWVKPAVPPTGLASLQALASLIDNDNKH